MLFYSYPIVTEAAGPVQPGAMPPMMATGETQTIPGQGTDRAALMQALMQNPDLAEQVQGSELSRILAGGGDFKVPSGYMKAPGGGVQPISAYRYRRSAGPASWPPTLEGALRRKPCVRT